MKVSRSVTRKTQCAPTCDARSTTAAPHPPKTMAFATESRATTTKDGCHLEVKHRSPQQLARDKGMLAIKPLQACVAKING